MSKRRTRIPASLWPRSWRIGTLRQRIALIVLLHAVLIVAIIAIMTGIGGKQATQVYRLPNPARVAAIVLAFERAPPDTYPDLIRAVQDDRLRVQLVKALPPQVESPEANERDTARSNAEPYRQALRGRPFRIISDGHDIATTLDEQPYFSYTPFRVIVGLPDGRAVEFQHIVPAPAARFITNLRYALAALAICDILVIIWLAAQTTVPVERLVRAVREDDPAQLSGSGPVEFTELGEAFLEMRTHLHGLIAERTRIIAAVAHDFRTYLTRLELRSDFIDDEEQRAQIGKDLAEMRQLMDDALTFAKPDTGDDERAEFDLHEILTAYLETRQDAEHAIVVQGSRPGLRVHATPAAFRRMVGNLVDNAFHYAGGPVTISVLPFEETVVIAVDDHGPGVPLDTLRKLVEPFVRLETSRARHTGGAGLGLSIVQALAHRFGGSLTLENRAEGGLSARLLLYLR